MSRNDMLLVLFFAIIHDAPGSAIVILAATLKAVPPIPAIGRMLSVDDEELVDVTAGLEVEAEAPAGATAMLLLRCEARARLHRTIEGGMRDHSG